MSGTGRSHHELQLVFRDAVPPRDQIQARDGKHRRGFVIARRGQALDARGNLARDVFNVPRKRILTGFGDTRRPPRLGTGIRFQDKLTFALRLECTRPRPASCVVVSHSAFQRWNTATIGQCQLSCSASERR